LAKERQSLLKVNEELNRDGMLSVPIRVGLKCEKSYDLFEMQVVDKIIFLCHLNLCQNRVF
jgi:hypothetical protein